MCEQVGLKLAFSFSNSDINMLVTHPLKDRLVCSWFLLPGKGWVFFT